jgi:hypothetical protein
MRTGLNKSVYPGPLPCRRVLGGLGIKGGMPSEVLRRGHVCLEKLTLPI